MSKPKSLAVLASSAFAGALLVAPGSSQATVFGFNVTGGCSESCSANALITPGAGTLLVVLSDTQANPRSAGDLLSSIEITPNAAPAGPTLISQAGNLIQVLSNGPGTPIAGSPDHWGVGVSLGQIVLETAGPFANGSMAKQMIIGPPDGSGNYAIANNSITDATHNPYIDGAGTFLIADAAITADTTFTSVSFNFGTGPDTVIVATSCIPGTPNCGSAPPVVPEPGTLALLGSALAGLGLFRRRRSA